jgi:molybdopterin synthase sulfur carrier subunit
MPVKVRIPGALRSQTGGITEIEVVGTDVAQALRALEETFPALTRQLRDEKGALRARVSIYVNDQHVRFLRGLQTALHDGDEVYVVPVIMGG